MLDQASISRRPYPTQQDKVKIIIVGNNLEIIPWLNLAACPYRFGQYKLASLAYVRRHKV